ncbi:hypothetical protein AVEN_66111-1 [Araneus ventricosus]|uniref:Uncharacterized protein n=1 Tax=Araneus ventricosus TaxID=182803 RepID=A0A4Y2G625_ARAVE|nr:hypothetical protein AVEN_66111-1 [Araneus ventricosus]
MTLVTLLGNSSFANRYSTFSFKLSSDSQLFCDGLESEFRIRDWMIASLSLESTEHAPCVQVCGTLNPLRVKRPPADIMWMFGEVCQFKCRLRHPTITQHYDKHPKLAFV